MTQREPNSQTARLIAVLKRLLKSQGLRQEDIAQRLGLSRTTLKRRLSGRGLTLQMLEALCGLAEIGLGELVELANDGDDGRLRHLSLEQESALHADVRLGFVFTRLREGWTAPEIQRECHIGEAALTGYLVRLEKLGLIDLLTGNRVRLKTARDIQWRKNGPMWHSVDRYLKDIFEMTDSDDTDLSRRIAVVKLSATSIAQIDDMFREVQSEVRRLAHHDRTAPPDSKVWYAVLLGARPFELALDSPSEIPWWRKKPTGG